MEHLLDPPMVNSAMLRRSFQSPSTSYSQSAVIGSGPASHPMNRSSGGGGVRTGVTDDAGELDRVVATGAAELAQSALGTPDVAGATPRRNLSVGGVLMTSWRRDARRATGGIAAAPGQVGIKTTQLQ
jgi:hypothetical protein